MEKDNATTLGLLLEWRACGKKVEEAIASRDYESCRKAAKAASSVFTQLIDAIELDTDSLKKADCKAEAFACVDLWRKNIEAMPEWLEDMKAELDSVQRRMTVRRKLGGIYGAKATNTKRSGIRVKLKAR